eukprot:scaffold1042_cov401-Prasinococcus_capsulatus_cf.AAC.12
MLAGTRAEFPDWTTSGKTGSNVKARAKTTASPTPQATYTKEEVAKHDKRDDCWIIVDGKVYDVTDYVEEHPGGDAILNNAGADSSDAFHGPQHPSRVFDIVDDFLIGTLKE